MDFETGSQIVLTPAFAGVTGAAFLRALFYRPALSVACAAARRAMGTR